MANGQNTPLRSRWLNRTVWGIALTSFFSDLSHETATAILPMFLLSIGAAPAALGIIEGIADAVSSFANLGSGWFSDRLSNRKPIAVGGYALTALGTASFALAGQWLSVLFGIIFAWFGRGIRGPIRDAIMTDAIPSVARGKAFGFDRMMDTLGAVLGPLAALWFVTFLPYRSIFFITLIPGLLAVAAFAFLVKEKRHVPDEAPKSFVLSLKALPPEFRKFLVAVGIFGAGDFSHTLLILRATQILRDSGNANAATLAVSLYGVHNIVYAAGSYPAGALGDRFGKKTFLVAGYLLSAVMCAGFLFGPSTYGMLLVLFCVAGLYTALEDSLERAMAADIIQPHLRGTGFGMLATVNGIGDFISSAIVGILWSAVSPAAGFIFAGIFSLAGAAMLTRIRK